MSRRLHILLVSLAFGAGFCLAADGSDVGRPNIIIVMADDMGYYDLGCLETQ